MLLGTQTFMPLSRYVIFVYFVLGLPFSEVVVMMTLLTNGLERGRWKRGTERIGKQAL